MEVLLSIYLRINSKSISKKSVNLSQSVLINVKTSILSGAFRYQRPHFKQYYILLENSCLTNTARELIPKSAKCYN